MGGSVEETPSEGVPVLGGLGARIRARRSAHDLTLVRLAAAAGLSHPFLSQVERGLAVPSVASLQRIALALGTSVVELLREPEDGPGVVESRVVRRDEGLTGPYGLGTARMLGAESLPFVPMEYAGDNASAGERFVHEEDEFFVVIDGTVELGLGDALHLLAPGDAATIAAGAPHRWRSADGAPYRLVVVKEGSAFAGIRADLHRSVEALLDTPLGTTTAEEAR